jgi:hypothetical protein
MRRWTCAAVAALMGIGGCAPDPGGDDSQEGYRPGLHAMMLELQLRHANLWFAGAAGNWALADFQINELEGLLEEIAELHPTYHEHRVRDLLEAMLGPAVDEVEAAVSAEDPTAFAASFDRLTASCNACHAATDRGMIVIQRPQTPPRDNLRFEP